uniref:MG3 domain-containing protein n=1 Tax=Soboliphyme baturini TaxID=241478 RepID=A0A183JB39_9BILA
LTFGIRDVKDPVGRAATRKGIVTVKSDVGETFDLRYTIKPCQDFCWTVLVKVFDYSALVHKHVFLPVLKADIQLTDVSSNFDARKLTKAEGCTFMVPRPGFYDMSITKSGMKPFRKLIEIRSSYMENIMFLREDRSSDSFSLRRKHNGKFVLQRTEFSELLQAQPSMVSVEFEKPTEQSAIIAVRNTALLPIYDVKLRSESLHGQVSLEIESKEMKVLPGGRAASFPVVFRFLHPADGFDMRCDLYIVTLSYNVWENGTQIWVNQPFVVSKKEYDQPSIVVCEGE